MLSNELKGQTIVILAQNFNPSIFNRHWLVKKDNVFLQDEDILPSSIFSPEIVLVNSKSTRLLVTPEQLQFELVDMDANFYEAIEKTLIPMVSVLKEIPYRAVGINFVFYVEEKDKSVIDLSKELFFKNDSKLFNHFDNEDARFGSYMSKTFEDSRLKLDVKPVFLKTGKETIQFGFNFHSDLDPKKDANTVLFDKLQKWQLFKDESLKIMGML